MSPPRRPDVVDLEWDELNLDHVANHIDPFLLHEMIARGDWIALPNREGHPPEHVMFIGRAPNGQYVTAILRSRPSVPGLWRPITGWRSSVCEREQYLSAQGRKGKRRG